MSDSRDTSFRVVLYGAGIPRQAVLRESLETHHYSVQTVETERAMRRELSRETPPAVVFVNPVADPSAVEQLRKALTADSPYSQLLCISPGRNVMKALEAVRLGALWYLTGEDSLEDVMFIVAKACVLYELAAMNEELKRSVSLASIPVSFIAKSPGSRELYDAVNKLGSLDTTVLLTGETGTGKTTLARYIHSSGNRAKRPFVALSCAAMPRDLIEAELFGYEKGAFTGAQSRKLGSIELADGGTLFLDEIGDLSLDLQPKLLTFLQDRELRRVGGTQSRKVNVRVIAATNRDLGQMVREGRFREDLYFRLNVVNLCLPGLRDRREDIVPLAESYLDRLAERRRLNTFRLTSDAKQRLEHYAWPGNVRELENVLERATIFSSGSTLHAGDLQLQDSALIDDPREQRSTHVLRQVEAPVSAVLTLAELERGAIEAALRRAAGDKRLAALELGVSTKTIYNKIKAYGLG